MKRRAAFTIRLLDMTFPKRSRSWRTRPGDASNRGDLTEDFTHLDSLSAPQPLRLGLKYFEVVKFFNGLISRGMLIDNIYFEFFKISI